MSEWLKGLAWKAGKPKGFGGSNPPLSAKIVIRYNNGYTTFVDVIQHQCRAVMFDHALMRNVETGKGNPTLIMIEKIAQALGVSSNELLK